jgi:hypothetical protein
LAEEAEAKAEGAALLGVEAFDGGVGHEGGALALPIEALAGAGEAAGRGVEEAFDEGAGFEGHLPVFDERGLEAAEAAMEGVEVSGEADLLADVVVAGDEGEAGLEGVEGEGAAAELEETGEVLIGAEAEVALEGPLSGGFEDCLLYTSPSPRDV